MNTPIPVIDLFAGPGGLGEGFSAFGAPNKVFKIGISIEMDMVAHSTLLLRSFYRQFEKENIPDDYFIFITNPNYNEDALNKLLDRFKEGSKARSEAYCLELGKHNSQIINHINESIKDRIKKDLPWVLIGGPPCQAYSLVGRARNKGKILKNSDEEWCLDKDPRSKLYLEYLQVLARFQPAVFVMENVKGMLSATINGKRLINHIIRDLQNPHALKDYNITPVSQKKHRYNLFSIVNGYSNTDSLGLSDFIVKSEKYGIPQRRHRVIIMGVRDDYVGCQFEPLKEEDPIPLKNAIYDLPPCYSSFSSRNKNISKFDCRLRNYDDWKIMLCDYYKNRYSGHDKLNNIIIKRLQQLGSIKYESSIPVFDKDWFICEKLEGYFCNHEPRSHIRSDFLRYFFVSCFGQAFKKSPKLDDFPKELLPAHQNANGDTFVDRFKVQLKNIPSTTITSHISKDGHYYIHPDPRQCRSLTVREAARLQTFPDDYFFCGNRTQQYHQVGNAVPPLLARQIAAIVNQIVNP